jgi:hypothetical protein
MKMALSIFIGILIIGALLLLLISIKKLTNKKMEIIVNEKIIPSTYNLKMSEQLDEIGYFDLIEDVEKLNCMKGLIDKRYEEDRWLIIPNDYYISSKLNIPENQPESSTSDFRAIEVYPIDMYKGNLESYIKNAKPIFDKRNLQFAYRDETMDFQKTPDNVQYISHKITINDISYVVFEGNVDRGGMAYKYLLSYLKILNSVLEKQNSEERFFILSADDAFVYCIIANETMQRKLEKIINETENKIDKGL